MTRWPRRRVPALAAPEELCRFVADEWPQADPWDAFRAWKQARHDWHDANVPRGTSGPLGDSIDLLVAERDTRRRLPPPDWTG